MLRALWPRDLPLTIPLITEAISQAENLTVKSLSRHPASNTCDFRGREDSTLKCLRKAFAISVGSNLPSTLVGKLDFDDENFADALIH
ncbi:unnamed protein product [Euphydryas editha]|uniref:Uncharacterized protein n=1 Tax=Euphydryas editha TaxID=104508 RepID=A0AAU9TY92_EUPED|nr:unnamed protein product [Euphydryas editha]